LTILGRRPYGRRVQPSCRSLAWATALLILTAHSARAVVCVGDCDVDDRVDVSEMVLGVDMALGIEPMAACSAFDADRDGAVGIDELVEAVASGIDGCPTLRTVDPGTGAWELVADENVAAECGLDPELLRRADEKIGHPWAVVRHGKLCHEFYPDGEDHVTEVYSATKTLGSLVTGIAGYQTRDLPRNGRKTGPLSDLDRVDQWLDEFTFNPEAHVAHVLAMVAQNEDLSLGHKVHVYDTVGITQINRLSDIINTAIAQDPERFGADLDEFTHRFLFDPLGMTSSSWTNGAPDKVFAFTWKATLREMARVGLLMLNDGVWNGQRVVDAEWIYKMTHPAFEDANTAYGYLTWLNASSNHTLGEIIPLEMKFQMPLDACAPVSVYREHPHGLSDSPDCNYDPPYSCEQEYDDGVWFASGAGGQVIVGHRGLDMVLVAKELGGLSGSTAIWTPVRPALVALDPTFQGDEQAFCAAYAANAYAPDLR
jgi:hypothetical protein